MGLWQSIQREIGDFNWMPGTTDAEHLNIEQARIPDGVVGAVTSINWQRDEVLKEQTTVQVPQDYDTPQDAFRTVPRRQFANYTIEIDETGDYSSEDWVIPPVMSEELYNDTEGGNARLTITRQGGSGQLNPNSVFVIGGRGQGNTRFDYTHPVGTNPWDDENAVWSFYGGEGIKLFSCGIGGSARSSGAFGLDSYSSAVKLEGSFDWGADLVAIGGNTKQEGQIHCPAAVTASGSVTEAAWQCVSGSIQHGRTGPDAPHFAKDPQKQGGIVYDQIPMMNESGSLVIFVDITGSDVRIRDRLGNTRVILQDNGDITFRNASGTNTARLDSSGNLTLAGTVTESGSP